MIEDIKIFGLSGISLFITSFEQINPALRFGILILTLITLLIRVYKDVRDVNK